MINKLFHGFLLAFVLTATTNQAIQSQSFSLIPEQSHIQIKGSSNAHDWEESATRFAVNMNLQINSKKITGIDQVNVTVKSNSITSDNSIMTNKTHDALKVEEYPEIKFKLVSVDKFSSTQNGDFTGTVTGDITLAGVTRRISMGISGQQSGNTVTIKGSKDLKMSDFKIKPPTAMLGALKTDDLVTVLFHLNFQSNTM